jgi:5,10-methylenetetrahydromethanopterin reductase
MASKEIWTLAFPQPGAMVRLAERVEADGLDGIALPDSQGIAGDPYVALGVAARVTEHLKLGTGVTNPYTRHPAVTASAIASVQAESGGRATLGIGRGNSSLAYLGLAPAPLSVFERYVRRLQGYLRGEPVELDDPGSGADGMRSVETLNMGARPAASRLEWLPGSEPKVPVDVAATGPRVIALAARLAEGVSFAVGADEERLAWAVSTARQARRDAGLDPDGISLGAYVNIAVHPDVSMARELVSGWLTVFSRYAALHGRPTGPVSSESRQVMENIRRSYDMSRHAQAGSAQASVLTDQFVDRYAIVGPAASCAARLTSLFALGLDRIVLLNASPGADATEDELCWRRLVEEVVPFARKG